MKLAYLLRKPLEGSLKDNILQNGCGALHIEGGRSLGRWPANVALCHKEGCKPSGKWIDIPGYQINAFDSGMKPFGHGAGHEYTTTHVSGGKIEIWICIEGCPVASIDQGNPGRQSKCFHNFQEEI